MLRIALLGCLVALALGVPVDNGVEGDPEIECGPTSITVNFNTRNTFEGHVYVKGLYSSLDAGCRNTDRGRQVAGIELDFSSCNTRRARSLNPRGVFVSTTVIVSFHPLFLTKVDRAYRVQCFYMEADKTVDTRLEVSMLTTDFQTQQVPMPVCRYEILDGPNGQTVEFAIVGQAIYHVWTCDTETLDTFCMIVHSCFVDDTNGDKVDLIDGNGCANDLYLLNNLEYPSDLMGGVEAHVFKYADRADLYFQCQITILVKEPGQTCPRPMCGSPPGRGAGSANPREGPILNPPQHPFPLLPGSPYLPGGPGVIPSAPRQIQPPLRRNGGRGKRQATSIANLEGAVGTVDVIVDLNALDMDEKFSSLPSSVVRARESVVASVATGDLCFSVPAFSTFIALTAFSVVALLTTLTVYVLKGKH